MKKKNLIALTLFIGLIYLLHSTPHLAVRTYVFFTGYPVAAVTTNIIHDDYHNEVDKEKFAEWNAKAYTLTKPPIEKATQGELRNYLVKKRGFFHIVEFYGEG
ncbi:hypothetical protein JCM9140_1544 [Halalkalibacter wakoensis JCM 9140]|uniref:Uncharacterized protein n=1 Tax=Halalkalibacter wakoensis JCM 9140 TaxID=1236970 RepID=W4Q2G3_9BACI|nr:hypothetical protein [Halalkalibacter wakoensis]GAE25544.1 hypothetical protein JCM9140_1544 [Halalkalibacter wakoensis JCM 9140]